MKGKDTYVVGCLQIFLQLMVYLSGIGREEDGTGKKYGPEPWDLVLGEEGLGSLTWIAWIPKPAKSCTSCQKSSCKTLLVGP